MVTTPVLSDQQIDDFKRDGFVVTPGVFDAAEVAGIDAAMNDLVNLPEEPGKHWVYWEESRFDADKKKVGMYHTTPIYEFSMHCGQIVHPSVSRDGKTHCFIF